MDIIFDVDGTLMDVTHRLHHITGPVKDWDAFHAGIPSDTPIKPMCDIAAMLLEGSVQVLIATGRSERNRARTGRQLMANGICYDKLYMRADGDHREDYVVKSEMLDQMRKDGYDPVMAFEDRGQVVKMWRERGLLCLQVAPGDF